MKAINKTYFNFLNKSNSNFNYIIIVFSIMLMPLLAIVATGENLKINLALVFYLAITVILSIFTIIYNFRNLFDKRAVDTYNQLPLTKQEHLITTLVFSIYQTLFYPTIMYFFANIIYLLKGVTLESHLIGIAMLVIIFITISQIINLGIVLIANSLTDAIVMLLAYLLLLLGAIPIFLYISQVAILESYSIGKYYILNSYWYLIKSVLSILDHNLKLMFTFADIISLLIIVITLLIASYSIKKNGFERDGSRSEQITSAIYGYPFLSLIYAFILIASLTSSEIGFKELVTTVLFVFIPYAISYQIYRRRIGLSLRAVVSFIIITMIAIFYQFGLVSYLRDNVYNKFPEKYNINDTSSSIGCYGDSDGNYYDTTVVSEDLFNKLKQIHDEQGDLFKENSICSLTIIFDDRQYFNFQINKEQLDSVKSYYDILEVEYNE